MGLEKVKLIDKEDARDIQEHHDLLADLADFTDTAKRMELVRTMKKVKKPLSQTAAAHPAASKRGMRGAAA